MLFRSLMLTALASSCCNVGVFYAAAHPSVVNLLQTHSFPEAIKRIGRSLLGSNPTEEENSIDDGQCSPAKSVMFLKTHKCGSSTLQNIFLRYAILNDLTVALPISKNYLGHPTKFSKQHIAPTYFPANKVFDIFAVHTRLNIPEHEKVMNENAKWVTVIRDPGTHFESLYSFFNFEKHYKMPLDEYAKREPSELDKLPRVLWGRFGRNQMLFDFGYESDMTEREIDDSIGVLDNRFDIVLIAERMDESLILMKEKLCWTLDDIVTFPKLARKAETKTPVSDETLHNIREKANKGDWKLYQHFRKIHEKNVVEYGTKRMAKEIMMLNLLRKRYWSDCGAHEVRGDSENLEFQQSADVSAVVVNRGANVQCQILAKFEHPILEFLRVHQANRLWKHLNKEENKK